MLHLDSILLRDLLVLPIRRDGLPTAIGWLFIFMSSRQYDQHSDTRGCHESPIRQDKTTELMAEVRSWGSWNVDRHPADNICGHLENEQLFQLFHYGSQDILLLNLGQPSLVPRPGASAGWIFLHLEADHIYAVLTDRVHGFICPQKCIKDCALSPTANVVGGDFMESS